MTDVIIPDGQPYFLFTHLDIEYAIYCWLEDLSNNVFRMMMRNIVPTSGGFGLGGTVVAASADAASVKAAGGVDKIMTDVFLPRVNELLNKQTSTGNVFPTDGIDKEKFNWIVKHGLEYKDGVIVLTL